jgi:hypothetical protein
LIAQNTVEKKNLTIKIPLPILAMAVIKPRAMNCEFTCSQSSSLTAQNTVEKEN